ncbi:MAG: hypothetical protein RLZZ592_95 [Pseudomonadota bacterium]
MSAVEHESEAGRWPAWSPWLLLGLGWVALYGPTLRDLLRGAWAGDQHGHGPIVLALGLWLMGRRMPQVLALPERSATGAGLGLLVPSLLLFVLGRSQDIIIFELGSSLGVIAACVLLLKGAAGLRPLAFGLLFLVFMIPLPGQLVDALTQPMKIAVSYVVETLLHHAGYPISRTGVILQIGPYQLLVADACAGLNTLFTLEAMGLLYMNLVRHASVIRNMTLAILVVPISFTANVIRVIALTLITYHLGDEAGQGFLHGFAGMVLFLAALMLILAADSLVRWLLPTLPAGRSR